MWRSMVAMRLNIGSNPITVHRIDEVSPSFKKIAWCISLCEEVSQKNPDGRYTLFPKETEIMIMKKFPFFSLFLQSEKQKFELTDFWTCVSNRLFLYNMDTSAFFQLYTILECRIHGTWKNSTFFRVLSKNKHAHRWYSTIPKYKTKKLTNENMKGDMYSQPSLLLLLAGWYYNRKQRKHLVPILALVNLLACSTEKIAWPKWHVH